LTGNGNAGTLGDTVIGPDTLSQWTVASDGSATIQTATLTWHISKMATFESGAARDTLIGPAGGSTWNVNGNGAGTLALPGGTVSVDFIGFGTLTGQGTDTLNAPGHTGSGSTGVVAGASFSGMGTVTDLFGAGAVKVFTYRGLAAGHDAITIQAVTG